MLPQVVAATLLPWLMRTRLTTFRRNEFSFFFFPFFLFPLLVVSGKNRQPEGNFESVSSICSWISCFGESVRAGVPSVFGIKNSKVRWIAATSADFCPRGGERTVIMYLWVSINHFRSPDRRGYRPLACGLKSYRFLARSIRCPRPGDIFLSSFFLFSPGFCRFFDGPPSGNGIRVGGKRSAVEKESYRGISVAWLVISEWNLVGVSKYRLLPCVLLGCQKIFQQMYTPSCRLFSPSKKYSGRGKIKNIAFCSMFGSKHQRASAWIMPLPWNCTCTYL